MQTTNFSAPDIMCDACATAIQKAVGAVPGVSKVAVDVAAKNVTITHEANVPRETLVNALDRAGFAVAP